VMPVVSIGLPAFLRGNQAARKIALYFVVPLGLTANAVGYSNHGNVAVTSGSLLGVSCVTAAATIKRLAPRRNLLNVAGCAMMLAATYKGRELERSQAEEHGSQCCSGCSH
jgi:hypothetical protein